MAFIVFEGLDGCGKETQLKLLSEKFAFTHFKYPTKRFSLLNDYLEKKVELGPKSIFLLFLSDIANEQTLISKEDTAIADRYVFSTIAYELEGIPYDQAKRIVETVGFLTPNAVFLLDIPATISQERKRKQKKLDRYESNIPYLERVRKRFLKLAEDRFMTKNWHVIDASGSIESVQAKIEAEIHNYL